MFNLLMRGMPWSGNRDAFPFGRLFEYTDKAIQARFMKGDDVLFDKLIELPCIFMQEGAGDELAQVGRITRARRSGKEIALEYAFDPDVPPLLNSTIYRLRLDLDMPEDFEFSRVHWAVKDVDLYYLLLRNFQSRRQRPTVFSLPEHERIAPELMSAMMPFDAGFTKVYNAIKKTATTVGLRCRRADDIWENPAIIQDIVSLIDKSRVVICDCTGRNPNVFYEIGIAHTLGREVILITQNPADIPFDLRHLRYVAYLPNTQGLKALSAAMENRLNALLGNS